MGTLLKDLGNHISADIVNNAYGVVKLTFKALIIGISENGIVNYSHIITVWLRYFIDMDG